MTREEINKALDEFYSKPTLGSSPITDFTIQQVNAAFGEAVDVVIRMHLEMTIEEVIAAIRALKVTP